MSPLIWLKAGLMAAGGFALLVWGSRCVSHDRRLAWIVLLSYVLRVASAIGFFSASFYGWPVFTSLQLGQGFWGFAVDCRVYHSLAQQIVRAWQFGTELPYSELGIEYFAVVAAVYRVMGSHPLFAVLFNCALAAVTLLVVYRIGLRLFSHRTALLASGLIGFWPSSLLWSAQLLKDSLSWLLTFLAVLLLIGALPGLRPQRSGWRWAGRCVLLSAAIIALTKLRFYLGSTLSLTMFLVAVPAVFAACRSRRFRDAGMYAVLVMLVACSTMFARVLNTKELLSPAHPDRAHYRLAMAHWEEGRLPAAADEFLLAMSANPTYNEASLGLATVEIQQEQWDQAIKAYQSYFTRALPAQQPLVRQIIGRLSVELGNSYLVIGHRPEAIEAYEQAVAFDPSIPEAFANLGVALGAVGRFEEAFDVSQRALELAAGSEEEPAIRKTVARTYVERGRLAGLRDPKTAVAALEEALRLDPACATAYAELALMKVYVGMLDEAVEFSRRAQESLTDEAERRQVELAISSMYVEIAVRAFEQGRWEAVFHAREAAWRLNPALPSTGVALGMMWLQAGDANVWDMFDYGRERLSQPDAPPEQVAAFAEAYLTIGDHALSKGRLQPAMSAYQAALQLDVSSVQARIKLQQLQAGLQIQPAQIEAVPAAPPPPVPKTVAPPPPVPKTVAPPPPVPKTVAQDSEKIFQLALSLFSSQTGKVPKRLHRKRYDFSRFDDPLQESTPAALDYRRSAFAGTGGAALIDPQIRISKPDQLLAYLPRALLMGFLAPFPWQQFHRKGATGAMRDIAGLEMVWFYALLPAMLVGLWRLVRQRRSDRWLLAVYAFTTAVPVSLVITNLGTLFRLRLLFLLPLLLIAADGDPVGTYRRLGRWLWQQGQRRRSAPLTVKPVHVPASGDLIVTGRMLPRVEER